MLSMIFTAALLLLVPGVLLALAAGLRGWQAVGASPALSFALVLVGVLVCSFSGLGWTPFNAGWIAAVVILLTSAVGLVRRRPAHRGGPRFVRPGLPTLVWSALTGAGLVLGTVVGSWTVVGGTGRLTLPNQGFDALFHVNVVKTIVSSGRVDPTVTGTVNGYAEGTSAYPDAFHAMAALIAQSAGSTPADLNALMSINALMASITLVAGVGLVALLRAGGMAREAVFAPVVLAATTGYPTDLIWRGPIWVFAFGIAMVPSFLVVLTAALNRRSPVLLVLLGASAAALALIHPSAALSAGILGCCLLVARWWGSRDRLLRDLVVLLPAVVLAAGVTLPLIGQALADSGGGSVVDWPAVQTPGEAVGELLLYNYEVSYPQVWLAIPALVGLIVGWRISAARWWLSGTLVFALLCAASAAYDGRIVQLLTGPWWNDRFRFEGLTYLALSPVAAIGLVRLGDALVGGLRALLSRYRPSRAAAGERVPPVVLGAVAAIATVVVVAVLTNGFYLRANQAELRKAYGYDVGGSVTAADLPAFRELALLAGNGPVLNDPNDGSAWMWSLAGVRPVFGAALTVPVTPPLPPARQLLVDRLNCIDGDAAVQEAVEDLGVRYVYSSAQTILGGPTPTAGFRELDSVRSLVPVYQQDGATIYRIDPQPSRDAPVPANCGQR